ncbi:MAG: hypothetical protein ACREJN_01850, partial [Nitrospiraceae bacterium]
LRPRCCNRIGISQRRPACHEAGYLAQMRGGDYRACSFLREEPITDSPKSANCRFVSASLSEQFVHTAANSLDFVHSKRFPFSK